MEFESGTDKINSSSFSSLVELSDLLKKHKSWGLKLAGHTDSQGSAESNMILSQKRASAVKTFLVSNGVDENVVVVEYYGETRPIATNDTPNGRQKNRRVEMNIIF